MRVEQPLYFLYGVLLFVCALAFTKSISSAKIKLHWRAVFLALGLGFIVVPGHGEFVAAPLLVCFRPPIRSHLVILGVVFFFLWWAIWLRVLKSLPRHPSGTFSDGP